MVAIGLLVGLIGLHALLRVRSSWRFKAHGKRLLEASALPAKGQVAVRVFDRTLTLKRLLGDGAWTGLLRRESGEIRLGYIDQHDAVRSISLPEAEVRMQLLPPGDLSFGLPRRLQLTAGAQSAIVAVADAHGNAKDVSTARLAATLEKSGLEAAVVYKPPSPLLLKAALLGAFLAAAVGLTYVATQRADSGLIALAMNTAGDIAAASEQHLYLQRKGQTLVDRPLLQLGIRGPVTDLAYSPEGELHLADRARGAIFKCTSDMTRCEPLPEHRGGIFSGTFRFTFSPDGNAIVATDNAVGGLTVMQRDGGVIEEFSYAATGLCRPNGIAFGRNGHLYVADSDHLRVAEFILDGEKLEPVAGFPMTADGSHRCIAGAAALRPITSLPGLRMDRGRPVALAQDGSGNWWTTLANMRNQPAEIAVFDEHWKQPRRLAGPDDLDSFALVRHGPGVVIADAGIHGLLQADAQSAQAQDYPAPALAEVLAKAADARRFAVILRAFLMGLMVSVIVLTIVVSIRRTQAAIAEF